MKLIIASNNAHKLTEMKSILAPFFDDVQSMREAGIEHETVEDGKTAAVACEDTFKAQQKENNSNKGKTSNKGYNPKQKNRKMRCTEMKEGTITHIGVSYNVNAERDENVIRATANLAGAKVSYVNTLNVYDILNAGKLVLAKSAVAGVEEVYAS